MLTLQDFASRHDLCYLHPLGNQEQKLALCKTASGELRVLRRYVQKNAPVRRLPGEKQTQLAAVYACYEEDGQTFSEEEYIDGETLSDILRRQSLDAAQAAAIAREICLALEKLHSLGLVHRDVKPENIMLTKEGRVVLLDLDAAALLEGTLDTNTVLLGTAGYAAPEQFGFSRCDVRADIFALGVVMNVMLTGEHPSVRLAKGRMGKIIQRCIQTNTDKRYQDVQALLRALPENTSGRQACVLCGAVSPGGGCIWCGGTAGRKKSRGKSCPAAAVIAFALSLAALGGAAVLAVKARRDLAQVEQLQASIGTLQAEKAASLEAAKAGVQVMQPEKLSLSGAYVGDDQPYLVPFTYDLDQDGEAEEYYFAVAEIVPDTSDIYCPPHGSRRIDPGDTFQEYYAPIICRATAEEDFVPVPELAWLIGEAEMQVYYLGSEPEEPIAVYALFDTQNGAWHDAVRVNGSFQTLGTWYFYCQAELGTETVEAGLQVTYRENDR